MAALFIRIERLCDRHWVIETELHALAGFQWPDDPITQ
jgi:hypothetical protein